MSSEHFWKVFNFKGKVVLEMGRFLAAACGYYVTSIVDMKVNKEQPYVIMDGGINHLNYYGQAMAMKQPYCTQLDTEGNEKTGGRRRILESLRCTLHGQRCSRKAISTSQTATS